MKTIPVKVSREIYEQIEETIPSSERFAILHNDGDGFEKKRTINLAVRVGYSDVYLEIIEEK